MKMLLTSLTVLLAASAYAKSSNEYYFRPAAGASALELKYASASSTDVTEAAGDVKVTRGDIGIDYAYGLNADSALGIYTFTGQIETKAAGVTSKADGMGDLHVYYKGQADVWHYGADLGINTSKAKSDERSSGGPSIKLNGGGLWTSGSWNYGGDLAYTFLMERSDDSSPANKTTEGNILRIAGFGEYNYGSGFVGAELSDSMIADSKVKPANTTTKGESFLGLKVYANYDFTEMVQGLLSVEDNMHPKVSDNGQKAYTDMVLTAGVRLNF